MEIVARLGREINGYYADRTRKDGTVRQDSVLVVGILKGAFVFLADLVRELNFPVQIDFMRIASYGTSQHSSGTIKLLMEPDADLAGRRILIVEDIIDSGRSMAYLFDYFHEKGAAEVACAVMVSKQVQREFDVPCTFVGVELEDRFLAGYGLDGGEMDGRQNPEIGYME